MRFDNRGIRIHGWLTLFFVGTAWAADENGQPRSKAWFDNKLKELITYYGADYGHQGTYSQLISIGGTWPGSKP